MTGHRVAIVLFAAAAFVGAAASPASAQYLGTFQWQFAPFCNVVTLDAVQQTSTIALSGFDDQCGAGVRAAATGSAHFNPNGTITLALTVTRPDGITLSSSVALNPATISGPWSDDSGNSGTFLFGAAPPAAGSPRPVTLRGVYSAGFTASAPNEEYVTQFSFGRALPTPPVSPDANIIRFGEAPTANCPGSFASPQAAPGQLCLYERSASPAGYRVINAEGTPFVADVLGAHLYVVAAVADFVGISGAWAVTIP